MSRNMLKVRESLPLVERDALHREQQTLDLARMEPRDAVDWIVCRECAKVIQRNEPHWRDPISNISLCLSCYDHLKPWRERLRNMMDND